MGRKKSTNKSPEAIERKLTKRRPKKVKVSAEELLLKEQIMRTNIIHNLLDKQTNAIGRELARNDVEWLQLCSLARPSQSTIAVKQQPLFKDAAELNALPLPISLDPIQPDLYTNLDFDVEEDDE